MSAVLISINKPHTDNIFSGKKRIEWRKKPLPKTTHYCYETKNKGGIGKVRGQFKVVDNIKFNPLGDTYRPQWLEQGCVPIEDLIEYANGDVIYANVLENIEEYDKPKELWEFIVPSKIGCCNEGKCRGCKYLDRGNSFNVEDDCSAKFCTDEYKPLRKAPQSWQFVEELGV